MVWQQKACAEEDPQLSGRHWLPAATLYNSAAYPHLKGDDLAEQAQLCQTAPMKRPLSVCRHDAQMEFTVPGVRPSPAFAYPKGDGPFPTG